MLVAHQKGNHELRCRFLPLYGPFVSNPEAARCGLWVRKLPARVYEGRRCVRSIPFVQFIDCSVWNYLVVQGVHNNPQSHDAVDVWDNPIIHCEWHTDAFHSFWSNIVHRTPSRHAKYVPHPESCHLHTCGGGSFVRVRKYMLTQTGR